LGRPLLCRLGFHKWQNYGKETEVFWKEPQYGLKGPSRYGHTSRLEMHGETVHEQRVCKRCGLRLRRVIVTNSDGTLSCVGWKPDTNIDNQ
jgi:hypothetical protein